MKHTTEETTDASGDVRMDKVYDLMITGYDGNLNFERDFLGEAMDMLNRNYVLTDLEVGDLTYSE